MTKSPYTFPARSRVDMILYLEDHASYHPMNSWNGGFCLAWKIKCNFTFDTSGIDKGEPVNRAWDAAWKEHVEADRDGTLFWDAAQSGLRQYVEGEWTNYPGIEQGEWSFATNGRSGGWLILTDAPSWACLPRGWASCRATWESRADFSSWLEALDFDTLRRFYRAIRVLDADLSRDAIKSEMEYQYAWLRVLWEEARQEEHDAAIADEVAAIEGLRPDFAHHLEN